MFKSRLIQGSEVRNSTQKCFELVWVKRKLPVGFVGLLGWPAGVFGLRRPAVFTQKCFERKWVKLPEVRDQMSDVSELPDLRLPASGFCPLCLCGEFRFHHPLADARSRH